MTEGEIYEAVLSRLLAGISDDIDKREGSIAFDIMAPVALELTQAYIDMDLNQSQAFVDTADMEHLKLKCAERGVIAKTATQSIVVGTFTPTTVEIDIGERFYCSDIVFAITEKIEDGKYNLKCETYGTDGNITGTLLPVNTVNGLASAVISSISTYGEDAETLDALRSRYYENLEAAAFGGNVADYRDKAISIQGVGGVKVLRTWNGAGTVKLIIVNDEYGVPDSSIVALVQNTIDPHQDGAGTGLAPIDHIVTVAAAGSTKISIVTTIEYENGYTWDMVKKTVKDAITEYFQSVCKSWAETGTGVLRIGKIETAISNVDGILEASNTRLNGGSANLTFDSISIPVLGTVNGYA